YLAEPLAPWRGSEMERTAADTTIRCCLRTPRRDHCELAGCLRRDLRGAPPVLAAPRDQLACRDRIRPAPPPPRHRPLETGPSEGNRGPKARGFEEPNCRRRRRIPPYTPSRTDERPVP